MRLPRTPPRTLPRTLVALAVSLTLGLALGVSPAGLTAVADPPPPGPRIAGEDRLAAQATDVLAEVQELLEGEPADGRSLTLALRDLRMLKDLLPPAEQDQAERILMRPGRPSDPYIKDPLPLVRCAAVVCVHYTETGRHQAAGSDGDGATTPPYIRKVRNALQNINDTYVAAGYRRPKPDGARGGGTDKVDVYIGDIGLRGLYGYCTSDDPNDPDTSGDFSVWAYCTLDNDYSRAEFPANTPLENMRVTAAHEYFHAVQYAYDAWEDGWILESTAAWVEDEMFDAVNDNRQYLASSPLRTPRISMDKFGGLFHYGTWIWWRYLTEKYRSRTGALPDLVLDVWRRLDGTPGRPNLYSTQGLARELAQRDTSLKRQFQLFSAANRHPATAYDEGGAAAYRPAAPASSISVSPGTRNPGPVGIDRNHLSSATVRYVPQQTAERDWRLRLALDLPPTERGSAAVVLVHERDGGIRTRSVRLGPTGGATATVRFSSATVRQVEVVMVNASSRFRCWKGTRYSCRGEARDDGLRLEVDARAFRA